MSYQISDALAKRLLRIINYEGWQGEIFREIQKELIPQTMQKSPENRIADLENKRIALERQVQLYKGIIDDARCRYQPFYDRYRALLRKMNRIESLVDTVNSVLGERDDK